jgi:hypothetical protein
MLSVKEAVSLQRLRVSMGRRGKRQESREERDGTMRLRGGATYETPLARGLDYACETGPPSFSAEQTYVGLDAIGVVEVELEAELEVPKGAAGLIERRVHNAETTEVLAASILQSLAG